MLARGHYGVASCQVGSRIFLFGGKGEEGLVSEWWLGYRPYPGGRAGQAWLRARACGVVQLFRDVYVLDLRSMAWAPITSQSPGPSPRMQHASLLVGHKIVVHGGWDGVWVS
jgi:hypothetical protein